MSSVIAKAYRLLLMLALTLTPVVSASSNQTLKSDDFSLVGSGRLHWWGISIYDAALYAPGGDSGLVAFAVVYAGVPSVIKLLLALLLLRWRKSLEVGYAV